MGDGRLTDAAWEIEREQQRRAHSEDQFKLPNGHWSISRALLDWVNVKQRAGLPNAEIVSQLRRVADVIEIKSAGRAGRSG